MILLLSTLSLAEAALPAPTTLTYEITVAGQRVGQRVLDIRYEQGKVVPSRSITSTTEIDATVAGVTLSFKQRVTAFADLHPASFHAVIDEDGRAREIQARWRPQGWTLSFVDGPKARSSEVPGYRLDISTVDLMDPGTRFPVERYKTLSVLSAETGEIWTGEVSMIGARNFDVAGREVQTTGYLWKSPQGKTSLFYDGEGYLVHYQMRLLGVEVAGTLRTPPPPGPDAFPVGMGKVGVEVEEL